MSEIKPSKIDFSKINILELLPQQPPFVVVDELLHSDSTITKTILTVREENLFYENGMLSESGLIENIAQTCAARMGFINSFIKSDGLAPTNIKIGFIGAIKNLVIEELPKLGETLTTTVDVTSEIFSITMVNAKVEVEEKLIASCEMKIALTDMNSKAY